VSKFCWEVAHESSNAIESWCVVDFYNEPPSYELTPEVERILGFYEETQYTVRAQNGHAFFGRRRRGDAARVA
jgi:hypothetical protein